MKGKKNNYGKNKKQRYSGKKEGTEGNSCRSERSEGFVDKSNDPSWYAATPQLMQDAASLSFANALGSPLTLNVNMGGWEAYNKAVPGVMAIHVRPTVGMSNSWTDPINIAARNIYSFVRHANSGHSNYDAPNLMMYLLACDGVFSMYAFLVRLYGIMMTYSIKNRYMPRAIVEAMGIDFDSVYANLANLRYMINMYVQKAGTLCVPSSMMYFMRHIWMFSNIYADAPSTKAQLYLYTPEALYTYVEVASGFTKPILAQDPIIDPSGKTKLTYEQLIAKADGLINGILTSEDLNIMSGDILKAYGSDKLWKMSIVPETYQIAPVFSPEVLTQIHNITVVGSNIAKSQGFDTFIVYENTTEGDPSAGALTSNPAIIGPLVSVAADKILDLPIEAPTPADVMVASRLMSYGVLVQQPDQSFNTVLTVVGSEVVTCLHIYRYEFDAHGKLVLHDSSFGHEEGIMQSSEEFNYQLEKFGMHPVIYHFSTNPDTLVDIIGDLDNYTVVYKDTLDKMHQTALMSMLNVPLMGVATTK